MNQTIQTMTNVVIATALLVVGAPMHTMSWMPQSDNQTLGIAAAIGGATILGVGAYGLKRWLGARDQQVVVQNQAQQDMQEEQNAPEQEQQAAPEQVEQNERLEQDAAQGGSTWRNWLGGQLSRAKRAVSNQLSGAYERISSAGSTAVSGLASGAQAVVKVLPSARTTAIVTSPFAAVAAKNDYDWRLTEILQTNADIAKMAPQKKQYPAAKAVLYDTYIADARACGSDLYNGAQAYAQTAQDQLNDLVGLAQAHPYIAAAVGTGAVAAVAAAGYTLYQRRKARMEREAELAHFVVVADSIFEAVNAVSLFKRAVDAKKFVERNKTRVIKAIENAIKCAWQVGYDHRAIQKALVNATKREKCNFLLDDVYRHGMITNLNQQLTADQKCSFVATLFTCLAGEGEDFTAFIAEQPLPENAKLVLKVFAQ